MFPESASLADPLPLQALATEQQETVDELCKLDCIATASAFGGLLLLPQLQANCLRLEVAVHLAVAHCSGADLPTGAFVSDAFSRLGEGYCGDAEDPSEDVFATTVNTLTGNYRLLQGIRESPAFGLQRLLNVLQTMPEAPPFSRIRTSVEALLRLSDAVIERAAVTDDCLGGETPHDALPDGVDDKLGETSALVRFTDQELAGLQLCRNAFHDFVLIEREHLRSADACHRHSALERRPILVDGGAIYLVLPTAVATAITRFVVERVVDLSREEAFEHVFARDILTAVSSTPWTAEPSLASIPLYRFEGGWLSSFSTEVDAGRFVHFVVYVDGLEGFTVNGFTGSNGFPQALGRRIDEYFQRAIREASARKGFREGLLFIVLAGLGRNITFPLRLAPPPGWSVEPLSAADLVTVSHVKGLDLAAVFKVLEAKRRIEKAGIQFLNINGFLNLAAWADHLDGHLVPPNTEPGAGGPMVAWVPQNALRNARHRYRTVHATRRVQDVDGRWILVQKEGSSFFPEDDLAPFFISEEHLLRKELRCVYVTPLRPWWLQIYASEGSSQPAIYNYWRMLCTWLCRTVPVLERAFRNLPTGPLLFYVRFGNLQISRPRPQTRLTDAELRSLINVKVERGGNRMLVVIADGFEDAFRRPENIAERLVVDALVRCAALVDGDTDPKRTESLVATICPNLDARHVHAFEEPTFRDYVSAGLTSTPIVIDRFDSAASRLGLGWKARQSQVPTEILGVEECRTFLNKTVQVLISELAAVLKQFGRRDFCSVVLRNFESAARDRERWRNTAQANMALRQDQAGTLGVIMRHESELNACFVACRILLEAAVCECPIAGPYKTGKLDLSAMMANASLIFHLGGWSDAIHWGAVEPRLGVGATGDIRLNQRFFVSVYEPFGRVGMESRIVDAMADYPEHYDSRPPVVDSSAVIDRGFLAAWEAEFGLTIDSVRRFLDKIEELAIKRNTPVLTLRRSTLLGLLSQAADRPTADAEFTLQTLCLAPRPHWHETPDGFQPKDWHPWRFRRRLSVLRRPFLQVNASRDPLVVFAPGMVRESLAYTATSFRHGDIPEWQAHSRQMCRWLGSAHDRQGRAFTAEVGARLTELGWNVEEEVNVTKLVGASLGRDYGDVDVLAWRLDSDRVLLIECKDLQYRKTFGEVAEQLAD